MQNCTCRRALDQCSAHFLLSRLKPIKAGNKEATLSSISIITFNVSAHFLSSRACESNAPRSLCDRDDERR